MNRALALSCAAAVLPLSSAALAQVTLDWYTIDCGGGTSSAGALALAGTIGQHDAERLAAGTISLCGGFWAVDTPPTSVCYPNCDGSTSAPTLNVADFICFLNAFAALDPYANCDASTNPPTLNVADFICFLNKFAAGCS